MPGQFQFQVVHSRRQALDLSAGGNQVNKREERDGPKQLSLSSGTRCLAHKRHTHLKACGSDLTSVLPVFPQGAPLETQFWHGLSLSHFVRCTRHQSHAWATWARFGLGRPGPRGSDSRSIEPACCGVVPKVRNITLFESVAEWLGECVAGAVCSSSIPRAAFPSWLEFEARQPPFWPEIGVAPQ